ncbi:MAG: SRPBCC domain-containing protein [Tissierellia bacterium]|nr:SRPBCC domain-containing protein [Tissierellia bacterium]
MKAQIVVEKVLPLSKREAWNWFTLSENTQKWYGPYRLEEGRLFVRLIKEEGMPEVEGRVVNCIQERELTLALGTTADAWVIKIELEEHPDGTRVLLSQSDIGVEEKPWIEAGWAYYLDLLLSVINHTPEPDFNNYAPDSKMNENS